LFLISNLKKFSSAGKRTARLLLAEACDSYVSCVHCVSNVIAFITFIALRALRTLRALRLMEISLKMLSEA